LRVESGGDRRVTTSQSPKWKMDSGGYSDSRGAHTAPRCSAGQKLPFINDKQDAGGNPRPARLL